jgi:hypothetical protein
VISALAQFPRARRVAAAGGTVWFELPAADVRVVAALYQDATTRYPGCRDAGRGSVGVGGFNRYMVESKAALCAATAFAGALASLAAAARAYHRLRSPRSRR